MPPSKYMYNPKAHAINCNMSGGGISSIDGCIPRVDNCFIHNNAGTGLYLGGIDSMATITCADVFENGNGNTLGVHGNLTEQVCSGIYVEQGVVKGSYFRRNKMLTSRGHTMEWRVE